MTGWIDHWRALPARNQFGVVVSLAVFIFSVVLLAFEIKGLVESFHDTTPGPADPAAVGGWLVRGNRGL